MNVPHIFMLHQFSGIVLQEVMTNGTSGEVDTPISRPQRKVVERPNSPVIDDLIVPIPIRPKPAQTITLEDLADMDKENQSAELDPVRVAKAKSVLPPPAPSEPKMTSVSITLNTSSGTSKAVLKALNGIAKLVGCEPPKTWVVEDDRHGAPVDVFRVKEEHESPMDIQSVLTQSQTKFCHNCQLIIHSNVVTKK